MEQEPDGQLPRPVDDAENLRRLRENARRRLEMESAGPGKPPLPAPVYGGAPIFRRRWSARGILLALAALFAALIAWFLAGRPGPNPAAVYGGPPPPAPYRGPK